MAALLFVGSDASLRIDDHRSHSQSRFSGGLLLSGALHLSLVFLVLPLTDRWDEGVVRVYRTSTEVFRQPPSLLPHIQLPPTGGSYVQPTKGIFVPKQSVIDLPIPKPGIVTPFPEQSRGRDPGT